MDDCVKKDVIYYSVKKIAALLLGLRQLNVVMSKIANELTLLAKVSTQLFRKFTVTYNW